jgi:uncharacterized protein with NRDE domain
LKDDKDIVQVFDDLKETVCVPKFDFPVQEIKQPAYATKTSTVVLVDYEGNVTFTERDWYDESLVPIQPGNYNDVVEHFKIME